MKKNILFTILQVCMALPFFSTTATAQIKDTLAAISLSAVSMESNNTPLPEASANTLQLKLTQIANTQGIGGALVNPRFIITARPNILSKDITPTAPPLVALTIEVTLFIGDWQKAGRFGPKTFSSHSITVKGVGTNEVKAYNNAINQIHPDDPAIQRFVTEGKIKIVDYYKTKCDEVLREADILTAANEYEYAIYTLVVVPEECKECYSRCLTKLNMLVKKNAAFNCRRLLMQAKSQWAASANEKGADSAVAILAMIGPNASPECDKEINELIKEMGATMKQQNNREWDYLEKSQAARVSLANDIINTSKQIAVEYAKSHPPQKTIHIDSW